MKRTPFFLALLLLFAAIAIAFALALTGCVMDPEPKEDSPIDSTGTARTAAQDTTSATPEKYPELRPPKL